MFKGKTSTGAEITSTFGFREAPAGPTWVLVANRTGAKLFESKPGSTVLEFPREFACPEGRVRGSDSYRDQPGRAFNSSGQSHGGHGTANPRHALGSETTHHEIVARNFAATLAAMLEKGEVARHFAKLVLVAEPRFLGILRQVLSTQVAGRITATLEKDIEEMPNRLLGEHLVELLKKPV